MRLVPRLLARLPSLMPPLVPALVRALGGGRRGLGPDGRPRPGSVGGGGASSSAASTEAQLKANAAPHRAPTPPPPLRPPPPVFAPTAADLVPGGPLGHALRPIRPGALAGPLLRPAWCAGLAAAARAWESQLLRGEAQVQPPTSMHSYGLPLEALGLEALAGELMDLGLWALGRSALGGPVDGPMVEVNGFLVRYGELGDESLGQHVDDSDLTLSLCLEGPAEGAALQLEGARCGLHLDGRVRPEERAQLDPGVGEATLHWGKLRHRVLPVRSGSRLSLILWARGADSKARFLAEAEAGRCPPWCAEAGERGAQSAPIG